MQNWFHDFVFTFVPLFIVLDAIGILPFVIALGEGMSSRERRRIIHAATITAVVIGLVFLFLGQFILKIMNISVGSFAIAGGIILLVLSIRYMTTGHMVEVIKQEMVAIIPIGMPLTVGPATITTLLLLAIQYPIYIVLVSFALNMLIVWITFLLSTQLVRVLGQGGIRAFSQVFNLLLAAIAVSMALHGLALLGLTKPG